MSLELDTEARTLAPVTKLYDKPRPQRIRERVKQALLDFSREERTLWIRSARELAQEIAEQSGEVCADDIHARMPVPAGVDGRTMAQVFTGLRWLRFQRSTRSECHYRTISVFGPPR